jgi:hypothetical protein
VEAALLRVLLSGRPTLRASTPAHTLTAAALNLAASGYEQRLFFSHAFSIRSCTTVLSRCLATGKEVSAPATLRLISDRLRGRLSESVFVFIMRLQAEKDRGGRGGLQSVPYPLFLPVFAFDFDFSMVLGSTKGFSEASFFEFSPNSIFRSRQMETT